MNKLFASVLLCAALLGSGILRADNIVISNRKSSILITAQKGESPRIQYFGPRLAKPGDVFDSGSAFNDPVYPQFGGQGARETAIQATHNDGNMSLELVVESVTRENRDGGQVTAIATRDKFYPFYVTIYYKTYPDCEVIETWTEIRHLEKKPVTLYRFASAFLPVRRGDNWLSHFHGPWGAEAYLYEEALRDGMRVIKDKDGVRNTQNSCPSFMLTLDGRPDEQHGMVIGGTLAWSGNFRLNFEVDEFNVLNILAGVNPYASDYTLAKGESFTTPEMVYTYSFEGAGGASRNLHDWARNYGVWHGHTYAPTLLNSWEGAYFTFDAKTLTDMIDDAADMGLEMFVLDDGWFGNKYPRNDANAGLGDWQINAKKLPEGIDYIASHAHRKGLKFGIWIEPEMVNPKSELAEKHPDWIVRSGDREMPRMRNQWLLDLTNPKVQDFVFSVFDNTMKLSPNIDYIKWDANRHAENAGSEFLPKDRQSHFWIDYVQGFYKVMERIRAKYPDVLIQACASGGGRVEYGAMKYFNEVWTSDNTEALSRARIQYGTSLFYPATVMGSHVSATPNHQTSNITPIKFRFDMACAGRLGMELQPKQMNAEEKAFARKAIESYKGYRDIVMEGDLYRIGTPYDDTGYYGVMYVSKDKKKAVLFTYCTLYQSRTLVPKYRLYGLDAQTRYKIREQNVDKKRFWFDGGTFTGEYLNHAGINPNLNKIYDSAVFVLEAE